MLDIEKIVDAMRRQPLCRDALIIHEPGEPVQRDVVGALLHAANVSDLALWRLHNLDYDGDEGTLFRRYAFLLVPTYGIESHEQLADLMNAGDHETCKTSDDRVRAVHQMAELLNAEMASAEMASPLENPDWRAKWRPVLPSRPSNTT